MPHTVGLRADVQCHTAVGAETNLRTLVRRAAGSLHEARHADAAQPAALRRCISAHGEVRMVGSNDRIIQIGSKPAAVDYCAERLSIRKLGHEIAPPQIDRIKAAAACGLVDQSLDHVVHFGLAGATVGVDGHGVGEHALHVHEDGGNDVAAAHRVRRCIGGTARTARRQIGAEIGNCGNIQCQKASFRIQCKPRARDVVAALRGGDEILRPLADPFDRSAQRAGRPKQHHPLGIQRILHAEAATDIGTGDMHLFSRHVEHAACELVAQGMHAGAREQQMEAIGVISPDGAARLHAQRSRCGC